MLPDLWTVGLWQWLAEDNGRRRHDAQEHFTVASFLLLLLLRPLLQTPTNTPQVAAADPINPRCEQQRGRTGCELRMRGAEMEQGSRRQPSSGGRRVEGGSRRSSRDGAGRRCECGVQKADAVSVLSKCREFHRKVIGLSSGRGQRAMAFGPMLHRFTM